jgi:hypothetical protein
MLNRFLRLVITAMVCLFGMVAMLAQTPETPAPLPKPQFFAGTVTELDAMHVRVSRTLVGHAPENRSFLINAKTKMNRATVKVKSRVTVRYRRLPEGDVALEVQLRPSTHPPRSS